MHGWFAGARRLMLKARYRAGKIPAFARVTIGSRRPTLGFEDVHRRLEIVLAAVYGRTISIAPIDYSDRHWAERFVRYISPDPGAREPRPATDGTTIELPLAVTTRKGYDTAVAHYGLLAIQQAERIERGTATHVPTDDVLVRDLYLLREGRAVDAKIEQTHPGLAVALHAEQQAALQRRPSLSMLTATERLVEQLLREALSSSKDTPEQPASDAKSSLEWATSKALELRQRSGTYRGLRLAPFWGTVRKPTGQVGLAPDSAGETIDAAGGNTTSDSDRTNEPDTPEPLSGSQGIATDDAPPRPDDEEALKLLPPAVLYDEWDSEAGRYAPRAVSVRLNESAEGDATWCDDTLRRHASLVRQVRHHFERLRARRALLRHQRSGDDLDIAACVDAIIDRRIGQAPDDRLYLEARPARRGLALSLLVDVSGSTETRVTDDLRIMDLEKIALLLAGVALDALGDLYAVQTFSGNSANNVKLTTIKDFGEQSGESVRRRIAALEPGGFTRLGAAVRHSTQQLARQSAGHRLLLILSDGRPNDVDRYQGDYGVEDSRHAIMEARASGVFPFCLTVDRDASEYLPRIFGATGHTILQRPEQLPKALLRVVQSLIGKP
ncbi:MAG: VWA domain-containing protein [bacterium]